MTGCPAGTSTKYYAARDAPTTSAATCMPMLTGPGGPAAGVSGKINCSGSTPASFNVVTSLGRYSDTACQSNTFYVSALGTGYCAYVGFLTADGTVKASCNDNGDMTLTWYTDMYCQNVRVTDVIPGGQGPICYVDSFGSVMGTCNQLQPADANTAIYGPDLAGAGIMRVFSNDTATGSACSAAPASIIRFTGAHGECIPIGGGQSLSVGRHPQLLANNCSDTCARHKRALNTHEHIFSPLFLFPG